MARQLSRYPCVELGINKDALDLGSLSFAKPPIAQKLKRRFGGRASGLKAL
jgi:hypothetical protein